MCQPIYTININYVPDINYVPNFFFPAFHGCECQRDGRGR